MSIFSTNVSLFICCFILSLSFISSSRERSTEAQLATQVCRNTTDFNFCNQTIYSDPRAPTADRIVLAYIAFGTAYLNATNIQTQIQLKITENEGRKSNSSIDDQLKNCMDHYSDAIGALSEVLGNLDSESYYNFDKMSIEVRDHAYDCEMGFNGTTRSPMSKENMDLMKHTDVCYAVAMLFPYTN
ncbi:hypothetical protein CASFOL_014116 [Castilleja foliolosa]|uniref:Pectinesterase inhibitor domain-containing protein n=1 Tax=Castilleja foliolosa TaxID=1961234 RepID=A0ABD3DQZ8_9LAMI